MSSPTDADEAIEALKHRAAFNGWPEMREGPLDSANESFHGISTQEQRDSEPHLTTPACSSATSRAQKGERAGSQCLTLHENQHPLLQAELVATPTFQFKGLVQSMDHFMELDNAYERHTKRAPGSAPEDDISWPASSEKQREYVQQLFESITDLSDFFELRKARERLGNVTNAPQDLVTPENEGNPRKRRRVRNGQKVDIIPARPKGMSKTDWALVDAESSPADLLEAVIHHRISGIEVELLCWRLLVRHTISVRTRCPPTLANLS